MRHNDDRYDEQVQSASAQIAQLPRSHEARLENEVHQAAAQAKPMSRPSGFRQVRHRRNYVCKSKRSCLVLC